MKTNDMITALETTFKNAGHALTETQSAFLTGFLIVCFEAIRKDEREKILDIYSELIETGDFLAGIDFELIDDDVSFTDIMNNIIKKQLRS